MKLTVLMDNHALPGPGLRAEHGFACHIQDGSHSVLLDTGVSDLTLTNAAALGIDLGKLDALALSHGHFDHTWGLPALLALPRAEGKAPLRLVAHPAAVEVKQRANGESFGCPLSKEELARHCKLELSAEAQQVSPNLTLMGRIPRKLEFEPTPSMGKRRSNGVWLPDGLPDDTALCCQTVKGIFVVTGCSHSGICNIIRQVKELFPGQPICGVLGGFHLKEDDDRAKATTAWLAQQHIPVWYPCHCTGLPFKGAMYAAGLQVRETGVGLTLEL